MARNDPTHTAGIRRRFMAEVRRRFKRLRAAMYKGLVLNDALGLRAEGRLTAADLARQNIVLNVNPPGQGAFDFPRSSDKVAAFMEWLREAQAAEVLGVQQGVPVEKAAEQAWTSTYIDSAYRQGVRDGANQMRKAGAQVHDRWIDAAFNRPIHADSVGLIYTRTYSELDGITKVMDQQISRELAQGLADGLNPREIARNLNDRVNKIGITRARTIARTEVVRAHQQASLNSYREAGAHGVDVILGVSLGPAPCEICEELAANGPYDLDEFGQLFPAHPNCVCAPAPRLANPRGTVLE